MNYKEIEDLMQSDATLEHLLINYKDSFERIDYYQDLFKNGAIQSLEETDSAMKELAGYYMSLNAVVVLVDTFKMKLEDQYYFSKRVDATNMGEKFVHSYIEKEASLHVSNYRRVRNIFQFYRDNCDKAILVCQSSLKSLDKEKYLNK